MNNICVDVQHISKNYGDLTAVEDLSFRVKRGEVFGLLGPNGAGKTTTLEMIEGLRKPDRGEIYIDGHSVAKQPRKVKEVIGVQLQSTSLYNKIKVGEALKLFGGYYKKCRPVDELLELVSLSDKRNAYHQELSGGQQQRLALALALVNDPLIVFLDEPTTGLDPQARRNLWDIILKMKESGKTVILTTHYMEEAEFLCDRLAIMDYGRMIAEGAPSGLIEQMQVESCLEIRFEAPPDLKSLHALPGVSKVHPLADKIELFSAAPQQTLAALIEGGREHQWNISDIHIRRATVEDLFLELTGRSLRE